MKQNLQMFRRLLFSLGLLVLPGSSGFAAELGKAIIVFTDPGTDLNPHLLAQIRALSNYLNKNQRAQVQIGRTIEGGTGAADVTTVARTLKIFRAFADFGVDPARIRFVQKAGRADGQVGITIVDGESPPATTRVVPAQAPELAGASFSVRYDEKGEPLLENDPGIKSFLLSAGQVGRDALVISVSKGSVERDEEAKYRAEVRALALYEILVRSGVPAARLIVAEPKSGAATASTFLWTKNAAVAARVKAEDAQVLQKPGVTMGLNLSVGMEKYRDAQIVPAADAGKVGVAVEKSGGSGPETMPAGNASGSTKFHPDSAE